MSFNEWNWFDDGAGNQKQQRLIFTRKCTSQRHWLLTLSKHELVAYTVACGQGFWIVASHGHKRITAATAATLLVDYKTLSDSAGKTSLKWNMMRVFFLFILISGERNKKKKWIKMNDIFIILWFQSWRWFFVGVMLMPLTIKNNNIG